MWYQAFGWRENPFSIRPNPNVVGLEETKEALLQDLLSGSPTLLLGPTGMGKTSLLFWLHRKLSETRFTPVYLNLQDLSSPQDRALQKRLRSALFFRRLHLSPGPILLLDEAQELMPALAEWLKAGFDQGLLFSFVLAGCMEPPLPLPLRSRIGPNVYHLGELSLPERLALLKTRMNGRNPFAEEALALLAQAAGPSPRALLQAAELVCKRLAFKAELGAPIWASDLSHFLPALTAQRAATIARDTPARHETKASETQIQTLSRLQDEISGRDKTRHETKASETPSGTASHAQRASQEERKRDKRDETSMATVSRPEGETKRDKKCVPLSPMQRDILRALAEGPKTIEELCAVLRSSSGSVRRQLSRLRAAEPRVIDVLPGSSPKSFVLTEAGRRTLGQD